MTTKRSFVLIRGLGREARHWGTFGEALKAQDFCSQIFMPDLPGAGVFYKEPGVSTISEMTDHIVEDYQSAFASAKPLVILGFSLGGMVALDYVSRFPDLFSEFILINSSVGSLSPFYRRLSVPAMPLILKIAAAGSLELKESLILSLTARMRDKDPEALAEHVHIAETAPVHVATLIKQIVAGSRFQVPKWNQERKGLILYSKNDFLVDPSCSEALAKHLSVPAFCHPQAGHDLAFDDVPWVIQKIADFLKN